MHCALHKLNLVINDAVQSSAIGVGFFDTIVEIFNFFDRSINWWSKLAFTEASITKWKLKRLCLTRWSSKTDAIRAVNRYTDILKVLTRITLECSDRKERLVANDLKESMENYEFIVFIVI